MKIKIYALEILNRWEVFQLLNDVLTLTDKHLEGMPQSYTDKLTEFRTAFDIYDEELVQERRPTPHQLLKVEEERDYAIRKIYQLIRYYSDYRFDLEKEKAAKALMRIFKLYGTGSKISRFNQNTQSAMITNLLQDLSEELPNQHIATLNLSDAVLALETNNIIFVKEQRIRNNLEAVYVKGVVRSARTNVQNNFVELVTLINALAVVEGQEKYAVLKKTMNILVREYLTQAKQRTKKKEKES